MQQVAELPPVFAQYRDIGGVLDFAVFEQSDGSEDQLLEAIRSAIPAEFDLDAARLREFGNRPLALPDFLGAWGNAETGRLIRVGKWYAQDGAEYDSPELIELEGVPGDGGVYFPPDPGSGGQFAYAFQCPPGGALKASPAQVQALFDELRAEVFPQAEAADIRDWSAPDLDATSDYFASGVDGWGIFLFTVHLPRTGRLTAIAGAADY